MAQRLSHSFRYPIQLLCLILCLGLPAMVNSQLHYTVNGETGTLKLTQLWYDGYWQKVDELNGTAAWIDKQDVRGKIALSLDHVAPHEPLIEKAQRMGARALLIARISTNTKDPGASMYVIDGSDRKRLKIPVFETIIPNDKHSFAQLPSDSVIYLYPTPNIFMFPGRGQFQIFANLLQSFMELAIICIGLYRLRQFFFYHGSHFYFFSIGPLCILLEIIGAVLRLAYTCVDPFYTYRLLADRVSIVLVTISFPFTLSAGAESLSTSRIEAKPFISKYRIPAIIVLIALFAVEIICSALRVTVQGKVPVSPNYISTGFYFIVSVSLIIGYNVAAILIARRLRQAKNPRANASILKMTIRVATSSAGYVLTAFCLVLYVFFASRRWGLTLILNGVFLGNNFAALMQVLALRPVGSKSSSGRSSKNKSGSSYKQGASVSAGPLHTVDPTIVDSMPPMSEEDEEAGKPFIHSTSSHDSSNEDEDEISSYDESQSDSPTS